MTATGRICPTCKFENHIRSMFCVQCGTLLACAPAAPGAAGKSSEPEPQASFDTPKPDTEELLRRVVAEAGFEYDKTRAGYRVIVPIGESRRQQVHVLFNGRDDEGHDVISFLSVCGPADERRAMTLLRFNSKLVYGAFAVKRIEDRDYFVVTANQLAATADADEIRKQLAEVAKRADAVEMKLSSGGDVY
ncbi:MAG: YbjN domain-containing protein [Phycisphaerae bacterium]|nr:YbjN domain-containing protein [Phycisphaerae bacterium]